MRQKFRRCVFVIAMAMLLVPFPSLAFSLGGAPTLFHRSETLDTGPHVAVCGLASSMELNAEYYIHLCAWNGDHSGGPVLPGATVWFEIQTAGSSPVMTSGMMTTDYQGRAVYTQKMDFGEGRFRIRAWMNYLGAPYLEHDWAYFDVYEVVVAPNTPPCPWRTPQGIIYCK